MTIIRILPVNALAFKQMLFILCSLVNAGSIYFSLQSWSVPQDILKKKNTH